MRFAGQAALVTGGGAGIGEAIARRLAREGAGVLVADLVAERAAGVAAGIAAAGGRAEPFTLDVAEEEQTAAAVAAAERHFGPLGIAVCNAGITDRVPALEMSRAAFERVIRTNLTGCFVTAQAAARAMVAHGGGGRIVTTSSVSGQFGGTGRAAYGASKAGIINLTEVLAMELAPHGILVNCLAPGPTQVARTAHGPRQRAAFLDRMALKRYATPEEIAAAVAFLCSEDAGFVTGHVLNVDGGFRAAGVLYDPSDGA
ncbi:SDR family NAD(P)-dependent oxidoreductase [Siccirubricoccus sp. G192]|uniref:SDR family NAD(P)-dependent oxidoreductase n=1 Tax=Siccirubricoccus sp. G192 TaxID=2849651 RepID=UPI001C2BEC20|nr:glucose 1-dehydrogenase [Siccirubricoccus sp. G192]MBV1798467.1 glucose 1-dehydrogenase [Siccirubricoccus sp. G192]